MVLCFVTLCNHQSLRDKCKYFRFPRIHTEAKKWETLCRRDDRGLDIENDRICSCHFVNGEKVNGPTIFPWSKPHFDYASLSRSRKRKPETATSASAVSGSGFDTSDINTEGQTDGEAQSLFTCSPSLITDPAHDYALPYEKVVETAKKSTEKICELEGKIRLLESTLKPAFCVQSISSNDAKMLMYTSLRQGTFQAVDNMVQRFEVNYVDGWNPGFMNRSDQLLLTLMNSPLLDLAERFHCSTATVNNIFITHVCLLHEILFEGIMENYMPSLLKCKSSMPSCFGDFTSCRLVIDATEVNQDVPESMGLQSHTYSSYKNNHTVKSVTGVAPNGTIVYVSRLYPGNTSDVAIVQHSKMLSQLKAGDMILADKVISLTVFILLQRV